MIPRNALALVLLLALGGPHGARANDANDALGAGGLVPAQSTTVRMTSEDLRITRRNIKVTYHFQNVSDQPQHVRVLFPFAKEDIGGDVQFAVPWDRPEEIFHFRVKVDGKEVTPQYRTYFLGRDGADLTERAQAMGLKPSEIRSERARQQGVEAVRYEATWEQDYAPKQEVVVEHEYTPVVGANANEPSADTLARHCATRGTWRYVAAQQALRNRGAAMATDTTRYILLTAKTWAGPIGDFHLTVERDNAREMLALCGFPLTRTGPGRFEMRAANYVPTRDIELLSIGLIFLD